MTVVLIALAGGLGAASRFLVDSWVATRLRATMPTGTVVVNVTGSLVLGMLTGWALRHSGGNSALCARYRSANARAVTSRFLNWSPGSGSNSRRRTISKPSSAVAGRHEDSTRPTTFRSRSSASRPLMPPTSTSSACVCGEPALSEAGSETTSRQFLASFADSVSAWAKLNIVSKLPAGRSLWS